MSQGDNEFAETTRFVAPATITDEYPFVDPPSWKSRLRRGRRDPKPWPMMAIIGGGIMALVPFALAVFLFLYFSSNRDDTSPDGTTPPAEAQSEQPNAGDGDDQQLAVTSSTETPEVSTTTESSSTTTTTTVTTA